MSEKSTQHTDDQKKELMQAWDRLQQTIADEMPHENWQRWTASAIHEQQIMVEDSVLNEEHPREMGLQQLSAESQEPAARLKRSWIRRRIRRLAAAVVLALAITTVLTPQGSEAFASLLNQFRMKQLAVVQEEDLRSMFHQVFNGSGAREVMNQYGSFSQTSGTLLGEVEWDQLAESLPFPVLIPKDLAIEQAPKPYIEPSAQITFNMEVDAINDLLKRLGALKLLPEAVDNKPITLKVSESVRMYIPGEQEYSLIQTPLPVVTADQGVPLAEAWEAFIQFPLLPEHMKTSLRAAGALDAGEIALPYVTEGKVTSTKVGNIDVLLVQRPYHDDFNEAVWVKDGVIYQLHSGAIDLLDKVSELIAL